MLNNSWGGGAASRFLSEAIDFAEQRGALFVAAAGNSGNNLEEWPTFPASYKHESICTVVAVGEDDHLAGFSNFGMISADIAAPGVRIRSAALSNTYVDKMGTSHAAPYVSGAAALVWSHPTYSGLTNVQLKALLMSKARTIDHLSDRCVCGGVLDLTFFNAPSFVSASLDSWNNAVVNMTGRLSNGVFIPGGEHTGTELEVMLQASELFEIEVRHSPSLVRKVEELDGTIITVSGKLYFLKSQLAEDRRIIYVDSLQKAKDERAATVVAKGRLTLSQNGPSTAYLEIVQPDFGGLSIPKVTWLVRMTKVSDSFDALKRFDGQDVVIEGGVEAAIGFRQLVVVPSSIRTSNRRKR